MLVIGKIKEIGRPGAHLFGYMVSMLTKIQRHFPVVALQYDENTFRGLALNKRYRDRIEHNDRFTILRNVTVESDGSHGQIYFNE